MITVPVPAFVIVDPRIFHSLLTDEDWRNSIALKSKRDARKEGIKVAAS